MMKWTKVLILLGVLSSSSAFAFSPPPTIPPTVRVNGEDIAFDNAHAVKDGRFVLVPLRGVFEKLGAKVNYNAATRDVTIMHGEKKVEMAIGRMHAWVNGKSVELDLPVRLENGRVLIPVRFVAEALNANVFWHRDKNTVFINTKVQSEKPKPTSSEIKTNKIEVRLTSDKRIYKTGETVSFTITARNTTNEDQILNFNSGQSFDIAVTPVKGSTPSWNWSHDMAFTDALREQTLEPKETITFSATWNQTDDSEKSMPRGEYVVNAKIVSDDEIEANSIRIRLSE